MNKQAARLLAAARQLLAAKGGTACPYCGCTDIFETSKFDGTVVDADECVHDFECSDCESLFNIVYAPIEVRKVRKGDEEGDFNPQSRS